MAETHSQDQTRLAQRTFADHIRRRLLVGLSAILAVGAALIVAGSLAYWQTDRAYSAVLDRATVAADLVTNLSDAAITEMLQTRGYLITGEAQALTSRELARQDFQRNYAALQGMPMALSDSATRDLQELGSLHGEYGGLAEEIIALRQSGKTEAAVKLFDERSDPLVLRILAARRALRDDITASITDASRAYSTRTGRIILGVVLAFVVGAILSGWLLSRLLTFPLYALDYFEHALVESVESADRAPIRLPQALSDRYSVVFRAYDALVSRLVESEASRLDFLGRVAHELRSPLAAIRGYADLLADPVMPPEGAEAASYARVIGRQSERMQQWVENLVMAAQIEEGLLKLFPAPMRPGPLLDKVVAEARERGRRGITVEDNLGLLRIQADALYLRHAFLNLVDYCMRLPAPDTPVLVTLRQAQTPGWAEIVVVDPALVVAEADLPALFSRSELVRGGRRPSAAGGVLGLYVVQRIIEMHQGTIAGHSRPGQGTTFVISLPLAEGKL